METVRQDLRYSLRTLRKSPGFAAAAIGILALALNDMFMGNGEDLADLLARGGKTVACTAKPCCYRCSIVLGLLGFAPRTAATRKAQSGMGSTQWVLQEPLKSALTRRYGDIQTLLSNFSNVTKL
jgi:hypothetical protein